MNQIGTSITGPRERGLHRNVGRALPSLKNSVCMLATREKSYVVCQLCKKKILPNYMGELVSSSCMMLLSTVQIERGVQCMMCKFPRNDVRIYINDLG
jgi:hypothetical protein